ncbi:hypothetical protein [uncultured Maribacter sp.]|uniref:3D domain-containing protein n=1 Tax=uncultured Maribacter sp. TaxID=431308 RepID=UPI00261DC135|nr:hypothetical protein [uncultured Maribacter sp.]
MSFILKIGYLSIYFAFLLGCKEEVKEKYAWKSMEVTITAYNSLLSQTSKQPNITAWGDTLKPGMQCVAVSRDLIKLGIKHNTQIKIQGIKGVFKVNDKMNKKWKKRMDIYMGLDIAKAKEWGKKKRKIFYRVLIDSVNNKVN